MTGVPIVRQISWLAMLPQLVLLAAVMLICFYITNSQAGMIGALLAFVALTLGMRITLVRDHRRGMRMVRHHDFALAIDAFQASYDFFTRHPWLDRYRAIFLMSNAAPSYREMALCNIAFCHSQLGAGEQAIAFYRRALAEFPHSGLAASALRLIESVQQRSSAKTNRV